MKEYKLWIKLAFTVLLCIILGITALTAAYCIPLTGINKNLTESAELLAQEGLYPRFDSGYSLQLDNFTDALMLHTAGYQIKESPLIEAALINRLECVDYISPLDSLVADVSHTGQDMKLVSYARYWHGYLVFLKPLLTFFTYGQIRQINTFVQYALIAILFLLLIKKKLYLYTIPTVFFLAFQRMSITVLSLQYSNVFYICMIGSIVLLLFYEHWKSTAKIVIYFCLLGVATAYVDLLTYPLITFGVPIALLLVLEKKLSLSAQLKTIARTGAAWLLGFAGMWGGKGVLASLLTHKNIIDDMLEAIKIRSVGSNENISLYWTFRLNINAFIDTDFFAIAVAFCGLLCILILLRFFKTKNFSHIANNLGFLFICAAPICWYLVLRQHSYIHFCFTYREWLISLFSGTVMLIKMYQDGRTVIPKDSTLRLLRRFFKA